MKKKVNSNDSKRLEKHWQKIRTKFFIKRGWKWGNNEEKISRNQKNVAEGLGDKVSKNVSEIKGKF